MLARVCVEDTFLAAVPELEPLGFQIDSDHSLLGMSWSDNLFTFAKSVADACAMMVIWASYLWHMCGLQIKPDSCEVIGASTGQYSEYQLHKGGF